MNDVPGPTAGSSVDEVHASLRDAILTGAIEADVSFSQVKLAQELGVSRTPLREALRMLETEGLIESAPNRKARVRAMSAHDLDELYGMRVVLESLAVFFSVPRMSTPDHLDLEAVLAELDGISPSSDPVGWDRHHERFHRTLIAHSGPRLVRLTDDLRAHSKRYQRRFLVGGGDKRIVGPDDHAAILGACVELDARLASVRVARHLARTALTLVTQMEPQHDPVRVRGALSMVESTLGG